MKYWLIGLGLLLGSVMLRAATPREIVVETKKIGEKVHWSPERIEVTAGEKIKIVAKHDLEGGFDYHGLFIPEIKVSEKVDRHKPVTKEVQIPKEMKAGEYKVGCQFHPAHVPAVLVVKAAK